MFDVRATVSMAGFNQTFNRIENFATQKAIPLAVSIAKENILSRTERGRSFKGYGFRKYSARHARTRKKLKLQTKVVDHHMTGALLDSLGPQNSIIKGPVMQLSVAEDQREKAKGLQKMREFIGVNQGDVTEMLQAIEKGIQEVSR